MRNDDSIGMTDALDGPLSVPTIRFCNSLVSVSDELPGKIGGSLG